MFDLLMSADMMVEDPDGMASLLVTKLGIHGHPRWRQAFPGHPYIAHFLRVHKSLAVSPTRVEPQGHLDLPNPGDPMFHDYLESLKDYQGRHRPMMTHAVVVTLPQERFSALVDQLMRKRVRFRLAQRTPEMPFDRLWLGVTPEDPCYKPDADGGLCIEIMPTEPLAFPPDAFQSPPVQARNPEPGEMVRVAARGFLVRDLDRTLDRLAVNLEWQPRDGIQVSPEDGARRAVMTFNLRNSATLDLIEPTRWDSAAGLYLNAWGPGPYYIRIAVNGLAAKADDLQRRGTGYDWLTGSEAAGGQRRLRVHPHELQGQVIEFEEA